MKILFCAYDQPGYITAGINAWMQRLIPDLVKKYNLDITTLIIYSGDKKQCPTISYFNENNLKTCLVRFSKIKYTEDGVKKILQIVKKNQFTVVVANHVVPALYAHKYLNKFNIPVIPVFHSSGPETKHTISKFINNSNNCIEESVSVSNYIKSYINKAINGKHIVIPCGTPMLEIYASAPKNNIKVIYAGRIEIEAKQIIKLTESFISISKKHSKFLFNIYGNGSYQNEVAQLIKGNSKHNVFFKGAVSPSEIINVIAQHHIFTLMSDYEGMPIALMEAMSCGVVPICLSEASGVNELIVDGVNGFIVKDRTTDYEEKLLILKNDTELWEKMSANAIKTIKEKYSSEITHKAWFDFLTNYNSIITEEVKVPKKIKLDNNLLLCHDYRKPTAFKKLLEDVKYSYIKIRLFIRPRARLRSFIGMLRN